MKGVGMKKSLFLFIPLFAMLLATAGSVEKTKKVPPSKTTAVKEKPKETDKQEQPKPNRTIITPAQDSPKQNQPPAVIKPAAPSQIQVLPAPTAPLAGEEINWQVISQGGTDGGSASYQLGGTFTQTAIGSGTSASYRVNSGFWQEFGELFLCGDANDNGMVEAGDVVYLLGYLFRAGPPPQPMCIGDANLSGSVEGGDVVYLITYLFRAGPPPSPECCSG
jgi:hypothetical protein